MRERGKYLPVRAAPYLGLVAVAVALSGRFWRPLLLYGHSSAIDAWRVLVFDAAFRAGDWYPRWTPDYYFGFGSPIFHFYAPLPYFLTELWLLAGMGVVAACKTTLVLAWALSGVFFHLLARDYLSRPASFTAAFFYMLAPYHLVDMLVRHAFGEHLAFAWLPLAFWGIVGCVRSPSIPRFLAGALGLALLILTHNITAMIAMPFLLCWCLVEARNSSSFRRIWVGVGSMATGLSLSLFFWLPALVEKELVWARESLTREYFHYADHFVYLRQLFLPTWGFGGSRAGFAEDRMSFQVGTAHWLWIFLALFAAFVLSGKGKPNADKKAKWALGAGLGVLAGAVFMSLEISRSLWDHIPLLAFVQFPWRFLVLACLGASLAAGAAVDLLTLEKGGGWRGRIAMMAVLCALVAYLPYTSPRFALYDTETGGALPGEYREHMERLKSGDRFRRYATVLDLDHLRASGRTGTSRDDFLPRTVRTKPTGPAEFPIEVAGGRLDELLLAGPRVYKAQVTVYENGRVYLNQFHFPGWTALVDGRKVGTRAEKEYGRVELILPKGRHQVIFRFSSTPLRRWAAAMSLLTLGLMVAWAGFRLVATARGGG